MRGEIDVVLVPDTPKLQLSPELYAILAHSKKDFADEMQAWLLERFGITQPVPDGEVAMINGRAHMNPRTLRMLEQELKQLRRASVPMRGVL